MQFLVTIEQVPGYDGAPESAAELEKMLGDYYRGCSVQVTQPSEANEETVKTLVTKLQEADAPQWLLAERVCELTSSHAADINNASFDAQVSYLIAQLGYEKAARVIDKDLADYRKSYEQETS